VNLLLCTLGGSWAVVPEVVALLDPQRLPLYRNHPRLQQIEEMQCGGDLHPPDEIWIVTTGGAQAAAAIEQLRIWNRRTDGSYALRIWVSEGSEQLDSIEQVDRFREMTFRVTLLASEQAEHLYLSLAGGRKTMSADLQKAAGAFGCDAIFHVVNRDDLPQQLRSPDPSRLLDPLEASVADAVMPVMMAGETRSELLDIDTDEVSPIHAEEFMPGLADTDGTPLCWSGEVALVPEFNHRRREGGRMFGNYLSSLAAQESHENWRMLYRLSPRRISRLKQQVVSEEDRPWLLSLPKADLHRHLGGCLSLEEQIEVARAVWSAIGAGEKAAALRQVASLLEQEEWDFTWPDQLRPQPGEPVVLRSHRAAALLLHTDPERLFRHLYGVTEPRIGLKHTNGFSAYERPGELTGSAILQHEAAIPPYVEYLTQQADREGLRYVELRGSPQKYLQGNGDRFLRILHEHLGRDGRFRFIIIADRRQQELIDEVVRLAVWGHQELDRFVVGLDLAGDEKGHDPSLIAGIFEPAFEACIPVTIHAGEGEDADKIWQAAYHLHADRVGHGLTLHQHPQLMCRFRDRNICLELCPSSNREVVGYNDPSIPQSAGYSEYPLQTFWKAGVPLTLCTDNPGISQTDLANEYIVASRMLSAHGGITRWEALAMIKQGFSRSFLPAEEKGTLIKEVDRIIFDQLAR